MPPLSSSVRVNPMLDVQRPLVLAFPTTEQTSMTTGTSGMLHLTPQSATRLVLLVRVTPTDIYPLQPHVLVLTLVLVRSFRGFRTPVA